MKWIEDRAEHLVACNHSREQRHRIEAAFDADHRLTALRDELWHDNGAYLRTHGVVVAELTLAMLPGPYRVPAYAGVAHVVLTNKTPCGTYRAPGRFEGTFARERLLDLAAAELDVDPLELRRRNLLRPDELPHERPLPVLGHDMVIDVGDFPGLLDRTLEAAGFEAWRAEAAEARAAGRLVGCGIGVFMEKSGGGAFESAGVSVDEAGAVRVRSGATSLGQGVETTLAAVVADALSVDATAVTVLAGDTDLVSHGVGSWASRSTVMAGGAARLAAEATAEKAPPRRGRAARGRSRRPRAARRPRRGHRRAGARRLPRRGGRGVRPRGERPPRRAAGPGGGAHVRRRADDLPLRRPPRAGRGRPRHGRGHRHALLRRLRGRPRGHPQARRGPARRRRRARRGRRAARGASPTATRASRWPPRSWTTSSPRPPRCRAWGR